MELTILIAASAMPSLCHVEAQVSIQQLHLENFYACTYDLGFSGRSPRLAPPVWWIVDFTGGVFGDDAVEKIGNK